MPYNSQHGGAYITYEQLDKIERDKQEVKAVKDCLSKEEQLKEKKYNQKKVK